MAKKKKYVYFFHSNGADGSAKMKNLLGGKGANLAEMCNLKLPVPAGFTITTEACVFYFENRNKYPAGLKEEIDKNLKRLETVMGKKFGNEKDPLLVSVRSGARASMPGMMDTVLNLGLNDKTIHGLIARTNNERFAYDSYRRFITMFGDVVMEIERSKFEQMLTEMKTANGFQLDTDLGVSHLKDLCEKYKALVLQETGREFPQKPTGQLKMAINAVFGSWNNNRAVEYRKMYGIPDSWGTAVSVQSMVFGNTGNNSGTGVAFTRDPSNGARKFFSEFLINAQGEDVVAGIRTPQSIDEMSKNFPQAYDDLVKIYKKLEKHYRDMLDIEFTVEDGKIYMLQNRVGKRTAHAAIRIAVEMVKEKMIKKEEAVMRIEPAQLDQLLHKMIDPKADVKVLTKGLPASPGAATGKVVFAAEEAQKEAADGKKVILVRLETSPEDIGGMAAAQGILTVHGGMTSHAAVVARGMGKCCVAGAGEIQLDKSKKIFEVHGHTVREGDVITLDGSTGRVILGEVPLVEPTMSDDFETLMRWADKVRRLKVRTNADNPHDAQVARDFGAEGIGLCRTEHMFFEKDRILAVREMILSESVEERKKALEKIMPMQREDFKGIFQAMNGLPVTIRLLDPPLHEFLPQTDEEIEELARVINVDANGLKQKVRSLHEFNPMLGHRGCRLGITFPEVYEMQVQAIMEAACELSKNGVRVIPEIMIPLVGHVNELKITREKAKSVADSIIKRNGKKVKYSIGTMIELPRASLTANQIAEYADFFSFGTNDLTQTTFGLSRDDSSRFLPFYIKKNILEEDPFVAIDMDGVGELVEMGLKRGRKVKKDLKVGICGEHGGEPSSVEFCHKIGMDYVSCSPFRIPIARLAAAQAVLRKGGKPASTA